VSSVLVSLLGSGSLGQVYKGEDRYYITYAVQCCRGGDVSSVLVSMLG
jgi:hypothetical protein